MIAFSRLISNRKSLAILAGVSLIAVLEFSRIHVPYCVKNKFKYRCRHLVKHFVSKTARICSFLNINSEPIVYRNLLKCVRLIKKIDNNDFEKINVIYNLNFNYFYIYVYKKIIDSYAKKCKLRIYSPKKTMDDLYPAIFYYHGGGFCFNSIGKRKASFFFKIR